MLTKQNIIANQKKLIEYESCKFRCKNKQDFCDNLSPEQVIGFADLCDSLGLQLVERQVDYYTEELVGRFSPYFRDSCNDFSEDESSCWSYFGECNFDSLPFNFVSIQLELPFK